MHRTRKFMFVKFVWICEFCLDFCLMHPANANSVYVISALLAPIYTSCLDISSSIVLVKLWFLKVGMFIFIDVNIILCFPVIISVNCLIYRVSQK